MKPQKTIEELKKEFANKIAKIKLKEKKEKEKILYIPTYGRL